MAFFMIDWISEGLNSLLLIEAAFATQNFASCGKNSSHGRAFVFSNNSSNVSALNFPTFISTLSAVRRNTLALAMPSASATNVTLPSSTSVTSYPKSCISLFKTDSRPKWQGAINSYVFIFIFLIFVAYHHLNGRISSCQ